MTPTLSRARIAELLQPYDPVGDEGLASQLSTYLDLLLKWNARMNLTAILDPEEIVCRHFGESLFVARHLPRGETLLDVGSGAGIPGLPIQLARPGLRVTLAESRKKKSLFLREAVRVLGVSAEVWAGRVEDLPTDQKFDIVTVRAVDGPAAALAAAGGRVASHGVLAHLTSEPLGGGTVLRLPNSLRRFLELS